MLNDLTYFLIFGKPLILYLGIITLSSFLTTAYITTLNKKGKHPIPFIWHARMARLSIALALFHGTLGILAYF